MKFEFISHITLLNHPHNCNFRSCGYHQSAATIRGETTSQHGNEIFANLHPEGELHTFFCPQINLHADHVVIDDLIFNSIAVKESTFRKTPAR